MRLVRIIDAERCKLQLQWEPADLWIGIFWRTVRQLPAPWFTLHVCLCLIPTLPLHLTLCLRRRRKMCLRCQRAVTDGRLCPDGWLCPDCFEELTTRPPAKTSDP